MGKNNIDIEKIREKILLSPGKVWGITSIKKQTGKTFLSKTLVEEMLKINKNVLYISIGKNDAVFYELGINSLDNEVTGNSKEIHWMYIDSDANTAEIIFNNKFEEWMEFWKQNYDLVIFDMEAVSESGVSKKICSLCDNNIVVLEKDREDGLAVKEAMKELQAMHINIAGVVLNSHKSKKSLLRM